MDAPADRPPRRAIRESATRAARRSDECGPAFDILGGTLALVTFQHTQVSVEVPDFPRAGLQTTREATRQLPRISFPAPQFTIARISSIDDSASTLAVSHGPLGLATENLPHNSCWSGTVDVAFVIDAYAYAWRDPGRGYGPGPMTRSADVAGAPQDLLAAVHSPTLTAQAVGSPTGSADARMPACAAVPD